jgi:hypothetical protein
MRNTSQTTLMITAAMTSVGQCTPIVNREKITTPTANKAKIQATIFSAKLSVACIHN